MRCSCLVGQVVSMVVLLGLTALAAERELPSFENLPTRTELPDPLTMEDGTRVTTRDQWTEQRRPELKRLFEHYMYGKMPPAPPQVTSQVVFSDATFHNGKGTLKEVVVRFGPEGTPPLNLLLVVPNQRQGRAPVFVGLNFCGNHAAVGDDRVQLPRVWLPKSCKGCVDNHATDAGRGTEAEVWCLDQAIDRGYAVATVYCGDIDPDQPDFTDGVHPHYLAAGQTQPGPHDWGSVAAWAWGLMRAADYLVQDPDIDPQRVAVIGHSRLGKAALLAGAFDERFAIVVPHQSGTGGCALSRNNSQETVERINRVFPHWFNGEFKKFGGHEDKLPIDQHLMVALVAPRALLDTEGSQDHWANFESSYRTLQAADPVYKLLGAKGLVDGGLVQPDERVDGPKFSDLMQCRRDDKHQLNRGFWSVIFDHADKYYATHPTPAN